MSIQDQDGHTNRKPGTPQKTVQFGRIPYAVVDSGALSKVKPAAMKLYLVLCAHSDGKWRAKVGMRRIAKLTGIQLGSVSRSMVQLVDAGLIMVLNPSSGQTHNYEIATSPPQKCSPVSERKRGKTVHSPVNASIADRSPVSEHPKTGGCSPSGAPSVHPGAQKCSPGSERNRENRVEQSIESLRDSAASDGERLFDSGDDKPAPKPRKRDELFDVVAELDGIKAGAKIPAHTAKRLGSVVAEIKAKGATPDEARRRGALISKAYPSSTIHALSKHWAAAGEPGFGSNCFTAKPAQSVGRAIRNAMTDPREVQI